MIASSCTGFGVEIEFSLYPVKMLLILTEIRIEFRNIEYTRVKCNTSIENMNFTPIPARIMRTYTGLGVNMIFMPKPIELLLNICLSV